MHGSRSTSAWIQGLDSFLKAAMANRSPKGLMCCPCSVCENKKEFRKSDTLWNHLALNDFISNYSLWTKHGEVGVIMEDNKKDDDGDNNLPDWAWVREAGGFQDEPMDVKQMLHKRSHLTS